MSNRKHPLRNNKTGQLFIEELLLEAYQKKENCISYPLNTCISKAKETEEEEEITKPTMFIVTNIGDFESRQKLGISAGDQVYTPNGYGLVLGIIEEGKKPPFLPNIGVSYCVYIHCALTEQISYWTNIKSAINLENKGIEKIRFHDLITVNKDAVTNLRNISYYGIWNTKELEKKFPVETTLSKFLFQYLNSLEVKKLNDWILLLKTIYLDDEKKSNGNMENTIKNLLCDADIRMDLKTSEVFLIANSILTSMDSLNKKERKKNETKQKI